LTITGSTMHVQGTQGQHYVTKAIHYTM